MRQALFSFLSSPLIIPAKKYFECRKGLHRHPKIKMKTALLAVTNLAFAASTDLRLHGGRPLCAEVDKGACQCENGNQIDEYRAMDAKCFLGT